MADISLRAERSVMLEKNFVRKLEERTFKRENARIDLAQQADAVVRARQAENAQSIRTAENARRLDLEERQRDEQLALSLRRLEQDLQDDEKRLGAEQTAIDLGRIAQEHEGALRAEDVQFARAEAPAANNTSATTLAGDSTSAAALAAQVQAAEYLTPRDERPLPLGTILDVAA